jgi:hypothetical protein
MRGPNKPKATTKGKSFKLDDLFDSASTPGTSEKSRGNSVKRTSSDVSRGGPMAFKVESSEDYGLRTATSKRKGRRPSQHPDTTLEIFRGNGTVGQPNDHQNIIQNTQVAGDERQSVSQDQPWTKSEPGEMSWNWTTKFDQQQDFADASAFDATVGLRYPHIKESSPHSPGVLSSLSVDTTNLAGFGSGYESLCYSTTIDH